MERATALALEPLRFGKYLLLERISVGGMAEVWRALQVEGARRVVAIKRLLPSVAEYPELVSMFIAEGTLLLQLDHPQIIRVYEIGERGGEPFISMEYVHGKDLRAVLDYCRQSGQRVPLRLACELVCKLCEALDYAHRWKDRSGREANLVHRDVSPSNLLLGFEGEIKLIDFGIARAGQQPGNVNGKRAYMSPEQAQGLAGDRRSDIFSVGVCFHEMLSGQRPGQGPAIWEIPPALEQMIFKALAPDPESRYQYASELAADLQRFLRQTHFEAKDLTAYMQSSFGEEIEPDAQVSGPPEPSAPLPKAVALGALLSNALAPAPRAVDAPSAQKAWSLPIKVSEAVRASVRAFAESPPRPDGDVSAPPVSAAAPELLAAAASDLGKAHGFPEQESTLADASALPQSRALIAGVGASAAILAIATLAYFGAQEANSGFLSLVIPGQFRAKPLKVAFRGEPLTVPPEGNLLHKAKAGSGVLTIEADGYQPFSQQVQIPSLRKVTEVRPDLVPVSRRAVLAIVAEPEDAEVRIDGNLVVPSGGAAFSVSEIPLGAERLVQVSRAGYKSFESRVKASTPGEQLKVRAKLQPIDYSLVVSSSPPNALIWANGQRLGRTPMELRLPATTPELMVSKRCYEPAHVPLSNPTETAEPLPIQVSLNKLPSCR